MGNGTLNRRNLVEASKALYIFSDSWNPETIRKQIQGNHISCGKWNFYGQTKKLKKQWGYTIPQLVWYY